MFSALNQGSILYVLDKTDQPKLKIGKIVSISTVHQNYQANQLCQQSVVDLKVNIDGTIYDYNSIPSTYDIITYNNGRITISETKQGLQSEVEGLLANSKQIVENIDKYKQNIQDYEIILKDLNPQFAKDKERDDRLSNLETKLTGFEDKIDKLINLINK